MNKYKEKLDKMYSSLGVFNVSLETKCKNAHSCWNGIEDRMRKNDFGGDKVDCNYAKLYSPWVGTSYDKLKLFILGINMNDCGGYDAEIWLAKYAMEAILQGKRKINFGNLDYPGTMFWHRVAVYAVAFLENAKLMKPNWQGDHFPSKEDVAKAFEYFAITNSIKCSPKLSVENDKSKPISTMWEHCPEFILKEEIGVLKPDKILICGNSNNIAYFKRNVLDTPCNLKNYSHIQKGIGQINGREIEIFVIPHPAAFGGTNVQILQSLIKSLRVSLKTKLLINTYFSTC